MSNRRSWTRWKQEKSNTMNQQKMTVPVLTRRDGHKTAG